MQYPDNYVQWVIHRETKEKRLIVANRFNREYHQEIENEKPFPHEKELNKGKSQTLVVNRVLAAAEIMAKVVKKAEEVRVEEKLKESIENEQKDDLESLNKQELLSFAEKKGLKVPKRLTKLQILEKLKDLADNTAN